MKKGRSDPPSPLRLLDRHSSPSWIPSPKRRSNPPTFWIQKGRFIREITCRFRAASAVGARPKHSICKGSRPDRASRDDDVVTLRVYTSDLAWVLQVATKRWVFSRNSVHNLAGSTPIPASGLPLSMSWVLRRPTRCSRSPVRMPTRASGAPPLVGFPRSMSLVKSPGPIRTRTFAAKPSAD